MGCNAERLAGVTTFVFLRSGGFAVEVDARRMPCEIYVCRAGFGAGSRQILDEVVTLGGRCGLEYRLVEVDVEMSTGDDQ
jgi:hypothetical protein